MVSNSLNWLKNGDIIPFKWGVFASGNFGALIRNRYIYILQCFCLQTMNKKNMGC